MRRILFLLVLASACRTAPAPAVVGTATATPPVAEWMRDAVIYEVNVRQFTPEGTFAALERHLPRLDSLGVDILWLMPVQPIGVKNRKGGLGSYYAIADYTAINAEHGTEADFRRFVDAAHRQGMRVILDWVANHSAHDHPWIDQHPTWYVRRADGTVSNARDNEGRETDWTDVAELNYDEPALRRAMLAEMRWWVDSMGIDGFRCDVAGGVPMEFWMDARRELTAAKPDVFLLAEAEGPQYHTAFHATYAWELHHLLNDVAKGTKPVAVLDEYFARDRARFPEDAFRMTFTSNHDENSWAGTEFERMGANHVPAFVLAATTRNAFPLLYTGQEASLSKRLRFFEKDTVPWAGPSLAGFYRSMFELKERNRALWNGAAGGDQVKLPTRDADRVYAFTRTEGGNTVLVAVNFGAAPATVRYDELPDPGQYRDWLTRGRASLSSSGTLEIPANGFRILVK
jgi:glycosidase